MEQKHRDRGHVRQRRRKKHRWDISLDEKGHFSIAMDTPDKVPSGEGTYKSMIEYGPACGAVHRT